MLEILNISPELIRGLSTGVAGAVISGFAVHFIERTKHKRLKRDNARLVHETEEIKSNYNRQLEELKRDHQLDITKRKHRYEKKSEEYMKFFTKLDELNSNLNTNSFDRLKTVLEEYNRNAVYANSTGAQNKALTVFQKKIQAIILDSNKDLVKLRHETHNIKLIASDNVIYQLQLLEDGFENLFDESNRLIAMMPALVLGNNEEAVNVAKEIVMKKGLEVEEIKKELIKTMRMELNDI